MIIRWIIRIMIVIIHLQAPKVIPMDAIITMQKKNFFHQEDLYFDLQFLK
jgi:hypothetical protein